MMSSESPFLHTFRPAGLTKAGAQCEPYKKWWTVPTLQMYKVELRTQLWCFKFCNNVSASRVAKASSFMLLSISITVTLSATFAFKF